jgi:hypothetical protein
MLIEFFSNSINNVLIDIVRHSAPHFLNYHIFYYHYGSKVNFKIDNFAIYNKYMLYI